MQCVNTTHMCAADALQEQSGDLSLSVKLCLSNTQFMIRLHTRERETSHKQHLHLNADLMKILISNSHLYICDIIFMINNLNFL